jgi:hypothetical protein
MKREGRWEAQKELVKRITKITTRILPPGEGVELRFINQPLDNCSNLKQEDLKTIFESMSWQRYNSHTNIGTELESKILEPLVYDKIRTNGRLNRPLLISIITDGSPEPENTGELARVIEKCLETLEGSDNLPLGSMCFISYSFSR